MLTRIWAILRSIYFLAIVGYAVWATPWMPMTVAKTFDEQYARCANALSPLQKATWLAVAWIALEVVVGWLIVWKNSHADRSQLKRELKEAKQEAKGGQTQPPGNPYVGS